VRIELTRKGFADLSVTFGLVSMRLQVAVFPAPFSIMDQSIPTQIYPDSPQNSPSELGQEACFTKKKGVGELRPRQLARSPTWFNSILTRGRFNFVFG
jgi:hypothetical protein